MAAPRLDGVTQGWVTFSTAGLSPGQTVVLAVQVATAVAQTGLYDWTVQVQTDYSGGTSVHSTVTGSTPVVVLDSAVTGQVDPYGAGWSISGVSRLIAVSDGTTSGVIWLNGDGTYSFFTSTGTSSFASPAGNFGTLVKNLGGSYTYTDTTGLVYQFDSSGLLTSISDPDGQTAQFDYNSSGDLTEVITPDGGTSTLAYSGGFLQSITEPGSRVVQTGESVSGGVGNLTLITDADGNTRQITYDAEHHATSDQWDPYDASFGYNASTGLLDDVNLGLGSNYVIAPVAAAALSTPQTPTAASEGSITDGLTHVTLYGVDAAGRETFVQNPDGDTQSWQRDANGLVTLATDTDGNQTSMM